MENKNPNEQEPRNEALEKLIEERVDQALESLIGAPPDPNVGKKMERQSEDTDTIDNRLREARKNLESMGIEADVDRFTSLSEEEQEYYLGTLEKSFKNPNRTDIYGLSKLALRSHQTRYDRLR